MSWTYFFVYSDELGSPERIRKFVDEHPLISYWYQCLPNTYFLVSTLTASGLTNDVVQQLGKERFLILDTNTDRNGRLPRDAWDLMKKRSPQ